LHVGRSAAHDGRETDAGTLMTEHLPRTGPDARRNWKLLSLYQRFEALVGFALTLVIAAVILVALYRLIVGVASTLVLRSLNPLDHEVFQIVFGDIMTVLIALEFNHTLRYVIMREIGIIQARTVILIALLALARKVIVIDLYAAAPATVAALGVLALSLSVAYWLIRTGSADDEAVAP
jgi:uncharacterized membrane protein (DUF373 family)